MKTDKEGQDLSLMQERVILAYEYLFKNTLTEAKLLRNRFNQILMGNLNPINNKEEAWTAEAKDKYRACYSEKNKDMLNDENFLRSNDHLTIQNPQQTYVYAKNCVNTFFATTVIQKNQEIKQEERVESQYNLPINILSNNNSNQNDDKVSDITQPTSLNL